MVGNIADIDVIERFLDRMVAHDWDAMADCVRDDLERVGPFGDTYRGKAEYVAFISDLMPKLGGYSMTVDRVRYAADGRTAVAELSEVVEVDGTPVRTPEALVFDLDGNGLIEHISIYIQNVVGEPAPQL